MIHPDEWLPADGMTLEPNALMAAKETSHCQALTAGPGAGKTEMLAQRADFLLRTGLCRYPKRILAISFKVDASQNLKERVQRRCGHALSARFDSYTFHGFAKRIIDRFRPILSGQNALDVDYTIGDVRIPRTQITFNDLVPLAIEILMASSIARNAIQQTYSDVFLDEFQDCTQQQYQLIKYAFLETPIRLTAVGDTKQKIMGWAGALEGIFATFAQDFHAIPLNLYRNFRSQPKLLRMQNEIIKIMDSAAVMPDEQIAGNEGAIEVQEYEDETAEAVSLAEQISEWITQGIPVYDIAILVSKQAHLYAARLMFELEQRGIPFRDEQQLQELSIEPLTQLITDYLLVFLGSREPEAYIRLMRILTNAATDEEDDERLQQIWHRFIASERATITDFALLNTNLSEIWEYVKRFLKRFGKQGLIALSADYESVARLREIIRAIRTHLYHSMRTEANIITAIFLLISDQAVRIMTIHKSKGLEFDTVIILGVEAETFWGDEDAERCAFFVGVSRAKRRLILTHAKNRSQPLNYNSRWNTKRRPHSEFLHYARNL